MKIGEILIRRHLLSPQQVEQILVEQQLNSKQIGELLIERHLISAMDLAVALQEQRWRRNGHWVIS
jgi:hypothetical protein